jgi:hypothetical protein
MSTRILCVDSTYLTFGDGLLGDNIVLRLTLKENMIIPTWSTMSCYYVIDNTTNTMVVNIPVFAINDLKKCLKKIKKDVIEVIKLICAEIYNRVYQKRLHRLVIHQMPTPSVRNLYIHKNYTLPTFNYLHFNKCGETMENCLCNQIVNAFCVEKNYLNLTWITEMFNDVDNNVLLQKLFFNMFKKVLKMTNSRCIISHDFTTCDGDFVMTPRIVNEIKEINVNLVATMNAIDDSVSSEEETDDVSSTTNLEQ